MGGGIVRYETGYYLRPKKQDGAFLKVSKIESNLTIPTWIRVPSGDGSYANWYLKLFEEYDPDRYGSIEVGISYSKTKDPDTPWRWFTFIYDRAGGVTYLNKSKLHLYDCPDGSKPLDPQPWPGDTLNIKVINDDSLRRTHIYIRGWYKGYVDWPDAATGKLMYPKIEIAAETQINPQVVHYPAKHCNIKLDGVQWSNDNQYIPDLEEWGQIFGYYYVNSTLPCFEAYLPQK